MVAKKEESVEFSKLKFSSGEVAKVVSLTALIVTAWSHIIINQNNNKQELMQRMDKIEINNSADGKIINSRLDRLEIIATSSANRVTELEKFRIRTEAKLEEEPRIQPER